jgi:molybdate transport system regulatory protein
MSAILIGRMETKGLPMLSPVIRFRIDFHQHSYVGPGKISLLEAIRDSGSLSQAARDLGMSYRRAWLLIDSLKAAFREPVTLATTGGRRGGGVTLTRFGEELVSSYRAFERDITALAARRLGAITAAVAKPINIERVSARRPLARRISRH